MTVLNALTCSNEKGGVLKSTCAAHLSAYAAAAGWDVLAIDTDAQANQSRDLGYVPDGGEALADALMGKRPLLPAPHPRWPNLHYVPGGPALDGALAQLANDLSRGRGSMRAFERALSPIAGNYHLIVIDTPPRELLLRRLIFAAVRYVVIPCQVDEGSIDGISGVFETVAEVRDGDSVNDPLNPELEVLGVFLGPIQNGATRTARTAREHINTLVGRDDFVMQATIRSAQSIAVYCRANGILSNEYEQQARAAKSQQRRWWAMTKEERAAQHTYSDAASGLASDWQALVEEIMGRYKERSGMVGRSAAGYTHG